MKHYIASFLLGAAALGTSGTLTSCNDYLDKYPDKRMELRTPDHLAQLLTSAYPQVHPAYLLEMYSDNTDRHLSPSWGEVDRFQREAYQWDDITDVGENESPQMIWNAHYLAVNTANEVLSFIRKQKDQSPFRAQSGEAKLCRAYAMLCLANVFCEAYDPATAASHLGLPYPEDPEDRPGITYRRGTLAELYARIDQDITEGLAEVGSAYTTPKFHFTPEAAHAFAARFYLYKQEWQKAVDHATKALGSHPENQLRNWAVWNKQGLNGEAMPNEYVRSGAKTNLLLQVVVSAWGLYSGPYGVGGRYSHGRSVSDTETFNSTGPWGESEAAFNYTVGSNSGQTQITVKKLPINFKYMDREAGIGSYYSEYSVFNADETLLVRAEAYARLKQYEQATADINKEMTAFARKPKTFTTTQLTDFYKKVKYYRPDSATVRKAFHISEPLDTATQEPLLQCILHLRRIMTVHEGLRMQDVKRYGITIHRRDFDANDKFVTVTDSMPAGDPRRAIQLPQDVISAGLTPNPRKTTTSK